MSADALREPMSRWIDRLQDDICARLSALDGRALFREDPWTRDGGGGGRTRVLAEGRVFEKAAVNTSVVYGQLDPRFAQKLAGEGTEFFAAGISLILHPGNPKVPTVHANFRFIIQGRKAWFGGGADLTPSYLFEEDARHFHRTLKAACDRHDPAYYPRFKQSCDAYFWLKHRGESRGVGGLFFEDLGGDLEREFAFVQDCGESFLPAYVPIVERRAGLSFTEAERRWQELRRGRYAEFNLLYDRGTLFGLETNGRIESILVSMPPRARWDYNVEPPPGSEEARLVEALRHPRDWVE